MIEPSERFPAVRSTLETRFLASVCWEHTYREWLATVNMGRAITLVLRTRIAQLSGPPATILVYWNSGKFRLGKLPEYPEIRTQVETLEELGENIKDVYRPVRPLWDR